MKQVPRHGLARALSKHGLCSRREAAEWIKAGRVAVDGRAVRDPEFPVVRGRQQLSVDGRPIEDVHHAGLAGVDEGILHLAADAEQTQACWYLSVVVLAGIGLNAVFGWWWADPVAALGVSVLLVREGREALIGETDDD